MFRLLSLTCLLAVAAAQRYFYCNSNGNQAIRDTDFYLITRFQPAGGYEPGLTCQFNAESESRVFFVEIESFSVSTAVLSLSSGGRILFQGSSIKDFQTSMTTPSKSLQVRFNATGDSSNRSGVKMRVRVMSFFGCPPDWSFLYGNCFGTSLTSGSLNFTDAQKACNSMRSNLLLMPATYYGSISSFVRVLPENLRRTFTWIGLTDRTIYGRYIHYWLSGERQSENFDVSCVSGGSYITCLSTERCGTISNIMPMYSIFMDACENYRPFACSMPAGGTNIFYPVPDGSSTGVPKAPGKDWIWGIIAACIFVSGLVGFLYCLRARSMSGDHSENRRRAAGTGAAVETVTAETAGHVTRVLTPNNFRRQELQPPPYFAPPEPPTYEEVMRGESAYTDSNK